MENQLKPFVEAYHKENFQARYGQRDSIIFPDLFSLESYG